MGVKTHHLTWIKTSATPLTYVQGDTLVHQRITASWPATASAPCSPCPANAPGTPAFPRGKAAKTPTPSGNAPISKTVINTVTNDDGSVTISYSDGTSETKGGGRATLPDPADAMREEGRRSAFAILEKEFKDNGLDTLIPEIKRFMTEGYGAEEASLMLPETQAYKTRFAGNEGRKALGLPVYTPGQYITAEQTYRDLFNQYNLGELANQETYNSLIGGAVSIDEAKARVDNVFATGAI